MKNFILAFFVLILTPIQSNAQVLDCDIEFEWGVTDDWIVVATALNVAEGANLIWSVNGEVIEEGVEVIDFFADFFEGGPYTVCLEYISDECPDGVLYCDTIEYDWAGGDDCQLVMTFDIYDYEGYALFEASDYPEGVNLIWYINDSIFTEGVNAIQITEDDIEGLYELEICVMYFSEECPEGVYACEDFFEPEACDIDIDGFYEQGFGYVEAYMYPEDVNLIWYIDGEQVAEGTDELNLSDLDLPNSFSVCVMYTNEECGSVEACQWFTNESGGGDCPEEISAIMPKWDMCSWAFEVEAQNEYTDVAWDFGDGVDIVWGSNWMSHVYESDGAYEVTVEFYSQSCPLGTFLSLTIEVDGCSEQEDCTLQMDTLFENNGTIMGWAYNYPDGVNLIWTLDDVVISEGMSPVYLNAEELPEEFELCVSYYTEECGDVTLCEEYNSDSDAVHDFESETSWSVFPVPTSNSLNFKGLPGGEYYLNLLDMQGRTVLEALVSNGKTIELESLQDGVYTLQVIGAESSVSITSKRVIVQR